MTTVAVAIICKTPSPGRSKTRLSPPLSSEECAEISGCFIGDLGDTIAAVAARDPRVVPTALYTPVGSEDRLRQILPPGFALVPQREGDFGERLGGGIVDLLALGHAGAIVINSDSPTLPAAILERAVDAVLGSDGVVLSPADDGGYVLIGLARFVPELFADVPWSTPAVLETTRKRAIAIALPVTELPGWYDIDDATSYAMLESELGGASPPFASLATDAAAASRTRRFVAARRRVPSPL